MQQAMLPCNGIQTHIITEGRWVEEGLAPTGHKDLVLVITGNPGIPSFYEGFIKALKSKLPTETPVWLLGHAGHVQPPANLCFALTDSGLSNEKYGLNGQIQHKKAFIEQYIPNDAKLHLVGHSIGCWFLLQLLKDQDLADRVVKCYLLFPTIERMAESPSGKFFTNILIKLAPLLFFLAWIFSFFPTSLQEILIRGFGVFFGITKNSVKPVRQMLDPTSLKRIFQLAEDEMKEVRDLDHEIISKYKEKFWIYYSATDGWTPMNYYEELKEKYPEIDAQICKRGFSHAFVLAHDKEVGKMIGDMINETISKS